MKNLIKWSLIIGLIILIINFFTPDTVDNSLLFRGGKIMYTSTNLNVRSKPSKDSKRVKTLKMNSPVLTANKNVTGWTLIGDVDSNKIGYVSAKYLLDNPNDNKQTTTNNKDDDIESEFNEFKLLYNELLNFKSLDDFKESGFGRGGKYSDWLERVQLLGEKPNSKLLWKKKGLLAEELSQLGLEYVKTKGGENETTLFFNYVFEKGLGLSKKTNIPIANVNEANNDVLISKWAPESPYNRLTLFVELYKNKDGKHYLKNLYSDGSESIKPLRIVKKKRQTRYEYDNNHGEYYILMPNGNIVLYDDTGEAYECNLVK